MKGETQAPSGCSNHSNNAHRHRPGYCRSNPHSPPETAVKSKDLEGAPQDRSTRIAQSNSDHPQEPPQSAALVVSGRPEAGDGGCPRVWVRGSPKVQETSGSIRGSGVDGRRLKFLGPRRLPHLPGPSNASAVKPDGRMGIVHGGTWGGTASITRTAGWGIRARRRESGRARRQAPWESGAPSSPQSPARCAGRKSTRRLW